MKVVELDKDVCLSTTVYDPNPNRFKTEEVPVPERNLPLVYSCDRCQTSISFETTDLEKHCRSIFTNLDNSQNSKFAEFINEHGLTELSFLDFTCPACSQPVKILFDCGPSGYWGIFTFEVENVLVLKE